MKRWEWVLPCVIKVVAILSFEVSVSEATLGCQFRGPYIELDLGSTKPTGRQQNKTITKYIGEYTAPEGWNSLDILQKREKYKKHVEEKLLEKPIYLGPSCDLCLHNGRTEQIFTIKMKKRGDHFKELKEVSGRNDPSKNDGLCTTENEMGQLIAVAESLELMTGVVYRVWKDKNGLLLMRRKELPEWAKMHLDQSANASHFFQYYLGGSDRIRETSLHDRIVYGDQRAESIVPRVKAKLLIGNDDVCGYGLRRDVQKLCLELIRNYRAVLCDTSIEQVKVFTTRFNLAVMFDAWPHSRQQRVLEIKDRNDFLNRIERSMESYEPKARNGPTST